MRTGDIGQGVGDWLHVHSDAADNAMLFAACSDTTLVTFLDMLTSPQTNNKDLQARFDSLSGAQLETISSIINQQNRSDRLNVLCLLVERLANGNRTRLEKLREFFLQEQNNCRECHMVYAEYSRIERNHQVGLAVRREEMKGLAAEIFTSPPLHAARLFNSLDKTWIPELVRELIDKHPQPLIVLLKKLGDNPDVQAAKFAKLAIAMLGEMSFDQKVSFFQEFERAGCLTSVPPIYDPRLAMIERTGAMTAFREVVVQWRDAKPR
jgi:hypothetical protein